MFNKIYVQRFKKQKSLHTFSSPQLCPSKWGQGGLAQAKVRLCLRTCCIWTPHAWGVPGLFLQSHRETADKCKMFQVGRVVSLLNVLCIQRNLSTLVRSSKDSHPCTSPWNCSPFERSYLTPWSFIQCIHRLTFSQRFKREALQITRTLSILLLPLGHSVSWMPAISRPSWSLISISTAQWVCQTLGFPSWHGRL